MNILTRITATLTGTLDQMVSHVENHDAIVEVALKDTRAAVAKAKIRLQRVLKDGEALAQRLQELERMERVWAERARSIAASDEAKALECIARRNQCREQAVHTRQAIGRHEELERKVGESVHKMEQRLSEIVQQRNVMRSRQSAADAMRVISRIEGGSAHGIEDTFDRWEMLITETEYTSGSVMDSDSLEQSFLKQESQDELRAELAMLLGDETHKNDA